MSTVFGRGEIDQKVISNNCVGSHTECPYNSLDAPEVPTERVQNCGVVEIKLLEMTGRRERDRKRTYWRYTFHV